MADATSLKDTIVPNSKQLNADELLSTPITITVTGVTRASGDQPVAISFNDDGGKPYYPCKTCRKVLIFAWGDDGREWVGKRMTLYCDPEVKFGGVKVGGIRISHMSDIERDLGLSLNITKGKKGEFIIKKMATIRPVGELKRLLGESAKGGTPLLHTMWKKFNAAERDLLGGACPDEFKAAAKDVDSAVPSNIGNEGETL